MVTTISSSGTTSSIRMLPAKAAISVIRSLPNWSLMAWNSSRITAMSRVSSARMALRWAMVFSSSASSSRILSRSSPVRRCRRMSRMAWACLSESFSQGCFSSWAAVAKRPSMRPCLASSGEAAARISLMTASRKSSAIFRPMRIWWRSSALRSWNRVRRVTTSRRKPMNSLSISRRVRIRGWPLTMHSMVMGKEFCSWVCW